MKSSELTFTIFPLNRNRWEMHYRGRERRRVGYRKAEKVWNIFNTRFPSLPLGRDWLLRAVCTRVPCSCSMCGHKREWDGPSIQERRNMGTWDG
jgi:hypothetical protein